MLMRAIATLTLLLALVAPASAQVGPPGLRYEATPNTAATSGANLFTPLQIYSGITTLEATISLVTTGSVVDLVTITNGVTVVTTLNGGTALTASVETVLSWRASASSTYSLRCETTTSLGKLYVVEIRSAIAKAGGSNGGSSGVASLTPWTSTIDAAGHDLIGAGNVTGAAGGAGVSGTDVLVSGGTGNAAATHPATVRVGGGTAGNAGGDVAIAGGNSVTGGHGGAGITIGGNNNANSGGNISASCGTFSLDGALALTTTGTINVTNDLVVNTATGGGLGNVRLESNGTELLRVSGASGGFVWSEVRHYFGSTGNPYVLGDSPTTGDLTIAADTGKTVGIVGKFSAASPNGTLLTGQSKALTNSTATSIVTVTIPTTDTAAGLRLTATVQAVDASHNVQCVEQDVFVAAINQNGTVTVQTPQYPAAGVGNAQQIGSGTLTVDWTTTVASQTVTLKATAASSLTSPAITCRYSITNLGTGVVTPQ